MNGTPHPYSLSPSDGEREIQREFVGGMLLVGVSILLTSPAASELKLETASS
jgi:hypothetical protein